MPSFSQIRDMYRLQKEAKRVKKELANIHVEAEGPGVKVVVSAEPEIVSITVDPSVSYDRIGPLLVDCLNRAMKKGQLVSAERMKGIMGEMGMPGVSE